MIQFIDEWLINHIYQPIVDWSQRDGRWWIQQTAIMATVFDFVCMATVLLKMNIDTRSVGTLLIHIACGAYLAIWARDNINVVMLGAAVWLRRIFLVIFPFISIYSMSKYRLNIVSDTIFLSVYFFAACRPPKPREKKQTKLALNF